MHLSRVVHTTLGSLPGLDVQCLVSVSGLPRSLVCGVCVCVCSSTCGMGGWEDLQRESIITWNRQCAQPPSPRFPLSHPPPSLFPLSPPSTPVPKKLPPRPVLSLRNMRSIHPSLPFPPLSSLRSGKMSKLSRGEERKGRKGGRPTRYFFFACANR